mmetsp:Transcript_11467/g.13141  ORF Transcript_11467/g.13141 Transcript_11467/m.13141 type:complete len:104 (+) Transcript_11467:63-374(+)|eukprot:CAMPEP_0194166294 /NCGR_PEP_ID=MMETSP0154-20130528/1941_1 /TAXON_ID=1049557 /ORGANISM="Thalassiothrix antarctica, Strain L6-D1" /LENGTH=103 /DNA_ID=CAMNT_0038876917 /DNA_START=58 /DNA_END=369 /DNA_ORIENTATION=-
MTSEKVEEAKQLDSVTDNVQAKEFDVNQAKDAMASLKTTEQSTGLSEKDQIAVSKEDVNLIIEQLDVTEEEAERALREAISEKTNNGDGKSAIYFALQKLITC